VVLLGECVVVGFKSRCGEIIPGHAEDFVVILVVQLLAVLTNLLQDGQNIILVYRHLGRLGWRRRRRRHRRQVAVFLDEAQGSEDSDQFKHLLRRQLAFPGDRFRGEATLDPAQNITFPGIEGQMAKNAHLAGIQHEQTVFLLPDFPDLVFGWRESEQVQF